MAFVAASAMLAGCALRASQTPTSSGALVPALQGARGAATIAKIEHVVVVVQENRSFDDLFQGYPGANTVSSGLNSKGQTIPLAPIPLEAPYEIDHYVQDFLAACDGTPSGQSCKMDAFDKEATDGKSIPPNPQYGYVPHNETKLYFDIARQYVLGDAMFTSHVDASFVSHQYIIAAQGGGAVNIPFSKWGCGGGRNVPTLLSNRTLGPFEIPCFDYTTIADELDAKGLPWHYYAVGPANVNFGWSAYQAIRHIYRGSEWKTNVTSPPAGFLSDVASGKLAAVTWVTPTGATSDHADSLGKRGPEWVASIVNAVGESPFWNSTVIFVLWDEWGGWYDHVPPQYLDYDGLGFRVPLLVVSPYAKRGYVSHVQYEHGSILKFIEDTFGLARLAASDTRANSPLPDCLDLTQSPRPFVPFATKLKTRDFTSAPPDRGPIDEE